MTESDIKDLIKEAFDVRKYAYAPYSRMSVGAALLSRDGRIFSGCNVENCAFGATICAEQATIVKAISMGCQDFLAIAICGGSIEKGPGEIDYLYPCGTCRQVLGEFCTNDFRIYVAASLENYRMYSFVDLLPYAFSAAYLG